MSTASERANLARIRDNQRRSRARRKEYLQELEARLRQCELQGIEASAEIQTAAREEAAENKKLRSLLAQHGVGDDKLDAYLQSSPGADSVLRGQYGSTGVAVQLLEVLLQARKPYYSDGITGAPGNFRMSADSHYYSAGKQTSTPQLMTPSSSSQPSNAVLGQSSDHSMRHYQKLTLMPLPRNSNCSVNHARQDPQFRNLNIQPSLSNSHDNHPSIIQQSLQPHNGLQGFSIEIGHLDDPECHELSSIQQSKSSFGKPQSLAGILLAKMRLRRLHKHPLPMIRQPVEFHESRHFDTIARHSHLVKHHAREKIGHKQQDRGELSQTCSTIAGLRNAKRAVTNLKEMIVVRDITNETSNGEELIAFHTERQRDQDVAGWPVRDEQLPDVQEKYAEWKLSQTVKMTAVFGWRGI